MQLFSFQNENVLFTSDCHFWHENIIKYCSRPFPNSLEMNLTMIENWNEHVSPEDHIFFLGDFGFGKVEKISEIAQILNGNIHFIIGNHDLRFLKKPFMTRFSTIVDDAMIEFPNGETLYLSHYPKLDWPGKDEGTLHLHGHSHGTTAFNKQLNRIDVGVDCWDFKPTTLEQIKQKFL